MRHASDHARLPAAAYALGEALGELGELASAPAPSAPDTVAVKYAGPDGRIVTAITGRVGDLTRAMELRGCQLDGPSMFGAWVLTVTCPDSIAGMGWGAA